MTLASPFPALLLIAPKLDDEIGEALLEEFRRLDSAELRFWGYRRVLPSERNEAWALTQGATERALYSQGDGLIWACQRGFSALGKVSAMVYYCCEPAVDPVLALSSVKLFLTRRRRQYLPVFGPLRCMMTRFLDRDGPVILNGCGFGKLAPNISW